MRALFIFFLITIAAANLLPAPENEKQYVWPLAIQDGISSTFQEFRANHFHAGIDLRTFQRTGFPVMAVADGVIGRISMSDRGFGRCLYLSHADGRYSVYGHLEKFRADIEAQVARVQLSRGEKYFGACALPVPLAVRRGEVIAFSGESGAGFAHLHLEIRDQLDRALNPLSLIGHLPLDEHEPLLKGILLRSRGSSLINDDCGEFYFKLRKDGALYTLAEPLTVTGPFDLSLHAFDLSDVRHIVAPYSLEAFLDGQPAFQIIFERLTRDDNNQLGMLYDMAYSTPGDYFINLSYQSGFTLEKTGVRLAEMLRQMPPGRHEIKIIVRDRQQNQSLAVIPLLKVIDDASWRPQKKYPQDISGNGIMQRTEFSTYINHDDIVVKVKDIPVPAARLRLKITQGDREQVVPAREYGGGVYFCFKPLSHAQRMLLRFELSDGRQPVEERQKILQVVFLQNNFAQVVRFHDFAAQFGSTSVLEPKVLLLEQVALKPEFPMLAGPVNSGPANFAFLDAVFFKFQVPAGEVRPEQLGIFKYRSESKKWSYIATKPDAEPGYLSCRVLTAGTFALLRDIYPPAIFFRKPASRHMQKLKFLVVRVNDRGKGIDERTVAVFLNGQVADAEYDPDWNHVLIKDLEHLQRGKNHMLVRASDRAGNSSEKNFYFSLK
jgi:hypothetical protein